MVKEECTVVNMQTDSYQVYIGRKKGTHEHFGNPFTFLAHGTLGVVTLSTREQTIEAFKLWLLKQSWQDINPDQRNWILNHMHLLEGKVLGCYCKPLSCHGDILKAYVEGNLK